MTDLVLLCTITHYESGEEVNAFLQKHHINHAMTFLCQGTAGRNLLSMLGLEETGKALTVCVTGRCHAKRLIDDLVSALGINRPGYGIVFTAPLSSVAGESSLKALTNEPMHHMKEGDTMEPSYQYEAIIAVMNCGFSDMVMDAARKAGARGGTLLSARGTNPSDYGHFFDLSIAEEKEILLILTAAAHKKRIMQTIMSDAGIGSPAHTVMFSVPVESVAGLQSLMEQAAQTDEI